VHFRIDPRHHVFSGSRFFLQREGGAKQRTQYKKGMFIMVSVPINSDS
jgi:hypothetical protein